MQLLEKGFAIIEPFISANWMQIIIEEIETSEIAHEASGVRGINKKLGSVGQYLESVEFKEKSKSFIGHKSSLVRALLFNKSPESNWYVTWHQDKTVSVSTQFDEDGWRAWSTKDNALHVQPPLQVLESMVTIRLHLDSATRQNGCLKVIPNSHKLGILSSESISEIVSTNEVIYCEAIKGSALIMRPHLLHSSSKSILPDNRRVLHLEFSDWQLPEGINWV